MPIRVSVKSGKPHPDPSTLEFLLPYEAARQAADPTSATGMIHNTQAVPNLTRITVRGSTNAPAEWLRLTIDPSTPGLFSWENVPYCNDPTTSCQ